MMRIDCEWLHQLLVENKAQLAALQAGGEVAPALAALFSMLQLLVILLLEKTTKKTPATSSLPASMLPFDNSTAAKAGAHSKAPKASRGDRTPVRLTVVERSSKVDQCGRCGEDGSAVMSEPPEPRCWLIVELVTTEARLDLQLKRGPNGQQINCGQFPDNMPAPLQYGQGLVAFAVDLLMSQLVPLKRTAQLLRQISGPQMSEARVRRVHDSLAEWEGAALERLLERPLLQADETSIRVNRPKHWLHRCAGADLAVKKCHRKCGAQALDDIHILRRCGAVGHADDAMRKKPVRGHDRWARHFKYEHCDHSLCGAH